MDRWLIFGAAIAGGLGSLTFLRIVSHELAVKNRQIEMRVEREREEIKRRAEALAQERLQETLDEQNKQKG